MKKLISILLVFVMVFALAACDKGDSPSGTKVDSGNNATKADSGNSSTKPDSGKPDNGKTDTTAAAVNTPGKSYVSGVIGDKLAPADGSQAKDHYHAKEYSEHYYFDSDGDCTEGYTEYFLDDPANYESANEYLVAGDWKPQWSSDKTSFKIMNQFISYMTVDKAIAEFEDDFNGYTLRNADGSSTHVDAPDDAKKTESMKEVFGFTYDDLKAQLGDYEYMGRYRTKSQVRTGSKATVDDVNALIKAVWDLCAPQADEGKMYTYMGKYGDTITEAPQITSRFDSAEFHYFKNGQEIKVGVDIQTKFDDALSLYAGIVK
ncbi:MAG: hypothetical protein J6T47_10505 [Lachnospiraceae bacterium]|nr:hypothetical protein [Lachnospiraceae bacterium]